MGTAIVILILIVIICFALKGSLKHYKGEGGCCGGGDNEPKVKKQKLDNVIGKKRIIIDGMMCENCRRNVENALNSIENVNAKVNLEKKEALLKLGADISDDVFMEVIKAKGYRVVSVQDL